MRPELGWSKPAIRRRHVVLPDPEGPSMAKNAPGCTSKLTPSTARTRPKWRETSWNETARAKAGSQGNSALENHVGSGGFPTRRGRKPAWPRATGSAAFHRDIVTHPA